MKTKSDKPLTALQQLEDAKYKADCIKYPNTPPEYIPRKKFSDRRANGLTQCILSRLHLDGWQAERISNTGRVLDTRRKVQDCLGRTRQIGSVEFVPGTGTNGTADIAATIKGRSVKIEVKIGHDRQSRAQSLYQQSVVAAGGIYIIATSFAQFYEQYQLLLK